MHIQFPIPDDATMLEVANLAAAANVVMISRGGEAAWCGRREVPAGWHIVGCVAKPTKDALVTA